MNYEQSTAIYRDVLDHIKYIISGGECGRVFNTDLHQRMQVPQKTTSTLVIKNSPTDFCIMIPVNPENTDLPMYYCIFPTTFDSSSLDLGKQYFIIDGVNEAIGPLTPIELELGTAGYMFSLLQGDVQFGNAPLVSNYYNAGYSLVSKFVFGTDMVFPGSSASMQGLINVNIFASRPPPSQLTQANLLSGAVGSAAAMYGRIDQSFVGVLKGDNDSTFLAGQAVQPQGQSVINEVQQTLTIAQDPLYATLRTTGIPLQNYINLERYNDPLNSSANLGVNVFLTDSSTGLNNLTWQLWADYIAVDPTTLLATINSVIMTSVTTTMPTSADPGGYTFHGRANCSGYAPNPTTPSTTTSQGQPYQFLGYRVVLVYESENNDDISLILGPSITFTLTSITPTSKPGDESLAIITANGSEGIQYNCVLKSTMNMTPSSENISLLSDKMVRALDQSTSIMAQGVLTHLMGSGIGCLFTKNEFDRILEKLYDDNFFAHFIHGGFRIPHILTISDKEMDSVDENFSDNPYLASHRGWNKFKKSLGRAARGYNSLVRNADKTLDVLERGVRLYEQTQGVNASSRPYLMSADRYANEPSRASNMIKSLYSAPRFDYHWISTALNLRNVSPFLQTHRFPNNIEKFDVHVLFSPSQCPITMGLDELERRAVTTALRSYSRKVGDSHQSQLVAVTKRPSIYGGHTLDIILQLMQDEPSEKQYCYYPATIEASITKMVDGDYDAGEVGPKLSRGHPIKDWDHTNRLDLKLVERTMGTYYNISTLYDSPLQGFEIVMFAKNSLPEEEEWLYPFVGYDEAEFVCSEISCCHPCGFTPSHHNINKPCVVTKGNPDNEKFNAHLERLKSSNDFKKILAFMNGTGEVTTTTKIKRLRSPDTTIATVNACSRQQLDDYTEVKVHPIQEPEFESTDYDSDEETIPSYVEEDIQSYENATNNTRNIGIILVDDDSSESDDGTISDEVAEVLLDIRMTALTLLASMQSSLKFAGRLYTAIQVEEIQEDIKQLVSKFKITDEEIKISQKFVDEKVTIEDFLFENIPVVTASSREDSRESNGPSRYLEAIVLKVTEPDFDQPFVQPGQFIDPNTYHKFMNYHKKGIPHDFTKEELEEIKYNLKDYKMRAKVHASARSEESDYDDEEGVESEDEGVTTDNFISVINVREKEFLQRVKQVSGISYSWQYPDNPELAKVRASRSQGHISIFDQVGSARFPSIYFNEELGRAETLVLSVVVTHEPLPSTHYRRADDSGPFKEVYVDEKFKDGDIENDQVFYCVQYFNKQKSKAGPKAKVFGRNLYITAYSDHHLPAHSIDGDSFGLALLSSLLGLPSGPMLTGALDAEYNFETPGKTPEKSLLAMITEHNPTPYPFLCGGNKLFDDLQEAKQRVGLNPDLSNSYSFLQRRLVESTETVREGLFPEGEILLNIENVSQLLSTFLDNYLVSFVKNPHVLQISASKEKSGEAETVEVLKSKFLALFDDNVRPIAAKVFDLYPTNEQPYKELMGIFNTDFRKKTDPIINSIKKMKNREAFNLTKGVKTKQKGPTQELAKEQSENYKKGKLEQGVEINKLNNNLHQLVMKNGNRVSADKELFEKLRKYDGDTQKELSNVYKGNLKEYVVGNNVMKIFVPEVVENKNRETKKAKSKTATPIVDIPEYLKTLKI